MVMIGRDYSFCDPSQGFQEKNVGLLRIQINGKKGKGGQMENRLTCQTIYSLN